MSNHFGTPRYLGTRWLWGLIDALHTVDYVGTWNIREKKCQNSLNSPIYSSTAMFLFCVWYKKSPNDRPIYIISSCSKGMNNSFGIPGSVIEISDGIHYSCFSFCSQNAVSVSSPDMKDQSPIICILRQFLSKPEKVGAKVR